MPTEPPIENNKVTKETNAALLSPSIRFPASPAHQSNSSSASTTIGSNDQLNRVALIAERKVWMVAEIVVEP